MSRTPIAVSFAMLLAGCASSAPVAAPAPPIALLGPQLTRQDNELVGQRFRTLLDFEHDADAVFVDGGTACVTTAVHTGARSLRVDGPSATISVDSLLYGAALPGDWTLLGAYVRVPAAQQIRTTLLLDGQPAASSLRQAAGDSWAFAAVDLTDPAVAGALSAAKKVRLTIESQTGGFLVDDVLLVNNRKQLVTDRAPDFAAWTVDRVGFSVAITSPDRFNLTVPSSAKSPDGWALEEVSAIRARFVNSQSGKVWTVFPDGRSIVNGVMSVSSGAPKALINAYAHPGEVVVDESTGRLNRDTPGDSDNDGYNEVRGAYQIFARGSRLKLRIVPHGETPLVSPVLEISHFPGRTVSAFVEGRIFDSACRIGTDTALVVLPITIDRPIEVTIKSDP